MTTVKADEVRIPRRAREAVARHEEVVILNRERPTFVIVHPDDHRRNAVERRGRRLRDALAVLANAAPPDARFAEDMETVLDSVGTVPFDPWARS
jgi:PHD/YefM family antitoxin component YafN of YafNO toxin-antitoxin module